jgi:hypothetical protein
MRLCAPDPISIFISRAGIFRYDSGAAISLPGLFANFFVPVRQLVILLAEQAGLPEPSRRKSKS